MTTNSRSHRILWLLLLLLSTVTALVVQQRNRQKQPLPSRRQRIHYHHYQSQLAAASSSATSTAETGTHTPLTHLSSKFPKTWVPIASAFELNPNRPNGVQVLGQTYVVYQTIDKNNKNQWVVVDSVCPHRLAPLFEGRLDDNGHLQCAYHGWSFDHEGNCVSIPQAEPALEQKLLTSNTNCHIRSYPVIVEKQIIFAWLWPDTIQEVPTFGGPQRFVQSASPYTTTYTRELPYDYDTLVENLADPSHVPFAHHNLQGGRQDATPVTMSMPSQIDVSGFNLTFVDRTMNMVRRGTLSFLAPYGLDYFATYDGQKKDMTFNLTALCVPVRPGRSRIILFGFAGHWVAEQTAPKEALIQQQKKKKKKSTLFQKAMRILPVCLIHQLSNVFLDSDLVFLHLQERERLSRDGDSYFLPAPSDRAIAAVRRWMSDYYGRPTILPPVEHNRRVLFDRWSQHSDQCRHCNEAVRKLTQWRNRTYGVLALSSVLFVRFLAARVAAVSCLLLLRFYKWLDTTTREGEFQHYLND